MIKGFENPGNKYRPIPFWSWNDRLDPEELKYQIREMKEAGVGGYFMHARSGLKTEYLSEAWFDCIKAGIEGAKEQGLDAWTYDEEGWPSGFAGGIVPKMSPDYHAKFISMKVFERIEEISNDRVISLYQYDLDRRSYQSVTMTNLNTDSENDKIQYMAVISHSNEFYVDTLNKRAIEAFIDVTHNEYYKRFGEEFGGSMKGFFTDEPRYTCDKFGELAWSDDLPGVFIERHGYDIKEHLPALFVETQQYEKYRYDFWETVSYMFSNYYMKTIYDWCEAHNCKTTGHIMMEESIFSQMTSTAGVMPFYEYLHVPGIDWLRRSIGSPVIGKQVGSVASQLGKKQVLTESFALCGWDVSFEELKWIAEWQFVNGVNQICQHLQAYTIKGSRKRDYPPSLFTQQTWWKEYGKFNDYLGRLCLALSEGDQVADVLLLHPMRSGYISFNGTRTDEIKVLDDKFEEASRLLTGLHISYHYGDETIISKYGSVVEGSFVVGRIQYKTVILPHMYAIDQQTLSLLLQFIQQGGTVISLGELPHFTNGKEEELNQLLQSVVTVAKDGLREYLQNKNLLAMSVSSHDTEVSDIAILHRKAETGDIFFLVNHSQETRYETTVTLYGRQNKVMRLVAEDGTEEILSARMDQGNTIFTLSFEPMQSHIIQLVSDPERIELGDTTADRNIIKLGNQWKIDRMDLNGMTLDYCSYRIDGGPWENEIPVIKLQEKLMILQRPCEVELRFDFHISADLNENKEFYVIIEDAALYQISVNGVSVEESYTDWWKDKQFNKVDIKAHLQQNNNYISLKTQFKQPQKVYDVLFGENVYETEKNKITYDIELESIYLLGDFGVIGKAPFVASDRKALITEKEFDIVNPPTTLMGNEFTTQGLLFFAGELIVSQPLMVDKESSQRMIIDFGKQNAPLLQIYINDVLVKDSLWAPYQADITDFVHEGENTLKLRFFASNRNLLGPHHHIDGECYNVGPESFTGKWSWVERKSEADGTDIADRSKNYWTDSYCFVEFGLAKQ